MEGFVRIHAAARRVSQARAERVAARIVALLDAAGIDYVVHEHVPVRTIAEARAAVPDLTRDLLKTVAFTVAGTPRIVLAAVPAEAGVDYKALAEALGCTRRDLRLLSAAQVEADLGFEVGGLGPFALAPAHEVVLDTAWEPARRVRCGAGPRTRTLELPFGALLALAGTRAAPIAKWPAPEAATPD